MAIWTHPRTAEQINQNLSGTMCEHIGLLISEVGEDYISATIPVDTRTAQHMGIVHGGASVVLAETVGSIAAGMCCPPGYYTVGLEINANHVRAGRPPLLIGTARPLHIGGSTMVWDIRIHDIDDKLVCVSRLTTAVLKQREDKPKHRPLPGMRPEDQA
jgi:1,4-dihydroxy-2-naphthoyl-CoA hydrolase